MSSSAIQLITNLKPNSVITNASTGLTVEQINSYGGPAWKDWLVKNAKENYLNRDHRYEVMNTDPMACVWTKRFPKLVTSKPFKSYDTDIEGQPEEVMTDVWERWEELNMNEALREIMKYCIWDGYCLGKFWISPEMALAYKAYGYYHCPPSLWVRINARETPYHNKIQAYYISYFPKPLGASYSPNPNMHGEDFYMYPQSTVEQGYQMFHFTRGEFNEGFGDPLGMPMWSTITKLRKISWYDFKRSCSFPIVELPADMNPDDMTSILDAWRNWDENNGMGLLKRINPNDGSTEDFPRVYERTPDATGATVKADPSSGGTLLRNAEYARILMLTGNSEAFYVGSQPGELESSKITLTVDDRAIIGEFNMYANIIKTLLKFLLSIGALEGLEPDSLEKVMAGQFDIKCHLEWEVLENMQAAADMAEEEASMKGDGVKSEAQKHNAMVNESIRASMKLNANHPMTGVMSSWVQAIGVMGSNLMVKFKSSPKVFAYPYKSGEGQGFGAEAEAQYSSLAGSTSKGGWIWDEILMRPSIYGMESGNLFEKGSKIKHRNPPGRPAFASQETVEGQIGSYGDAAGTIQEMHDYKTGILGTSREAFTMGELGYVGGTQVKSKAKASKPGDTAAARPKKKARGGGMGGSAPAARAAKAASYMVDLDTLSFAKMNSALKERFGQGMSKNAYTNLRIWMNEQTDYIKYNSVSIGKPMDFDIDLWYTFSGKRVKMRPCKKEFKKLEKHTGDVVVYSDQEHHGIKYNIGYYDYYWDDKLDSGMVKMNYDTEKLLSLVPDNSNIALRIKAGLEPEMSTEYFSDDIEKDGVLWQTNIRNEHGEKKFRAIAIVNYGNCPSNKCEFKEVAE